MDNYLSTKNVFCQSWGIPNVFVFSQQEGGKHVQLSVELKMYVPLQKILFRHCHLRTPTC